MTDYLTTFACRAERDDLFFEKGFDREVFEKKKSQHISFSAIKKIFYYKKLKITTTDNTKISF